MGSKADILCPNLFDWFGGREVCYQGLYLAFSEYCKQFSEALNICGLSLGGVLALQYGIENPDKINSLALAATQYTMPKKLLQLQSILFKLMPKRAFQGMGISKPDFISLSKSMMDLYFQNDLKHINSPVMAICGICPLPLAKIRSCKRIRSRFFVSPLWRTAQSSAEYRSCSTLHRSALPQGQAR